MSVEDSITTIKDNMVEHFKDDAQNFKEISDRAEERGQELSKIKEAVYETRLYAKGAHEETLKVNTKLQEHEARIRSLEDYRLLAKQEVDSILENKKDLQTRTRDFWGKFIFWCVTGVLGIMITATVLHYLNQASSKVENLTTLLTDPEYKAQINY